MALLVAEIDKMQLPALVAGVMQEVITYDPVFQILPFKNLNGLNIHQYTRENSLGPVGNTGSFIIPTGTVNESAPTFTSLQDHVKVIVETVNIPKIALTDSNAFTAAIAAKTKVIARTFGKQFINGSGSFADADFTGLKYLVTGSATDLNVSASLSLAKIDEGFDALKSGPASAIIASPKTCRKIKSLYQAVGGLRPSDLIQSNFGMGVFAYENVPVLKNEWVSDSDLYIVYANELMGLTGFFNSTSVIEVSAPFEVPNSDMVQVKVAFRVGVSLQSSQAVVRLNQLL